MRQFRFEAGLAGLVVALFAAVWVWQGGGGFRGPLTAEETNAYYEQQAIPLPSDPAYGPLEPYTMAVLNVLLVPVSGGRLVPEPRLIAGVSLVIALLGIAWFRAVRFRPPQP